MKYKNKKNVYPCLIILLGITGYILSIVSLHSFTGAILQGNEYNSYCNINETLNCNKVNLSSYSSMLGLPLSSWGIIFYSVIIFFGIYILFTFSKTVILALCCLGILSSLFSIYLFCISEFIIKALCINCLCLYLINFIILIVSLTCFFKEKKETKIPLSFKNIFLQILTPGVFQENKTFIFGISFCIVMFLNFVFLQYLTEYFENSVKLSANFQQFEKNKDYNDKFDAWNANMSNKISDSESDYFLGNKSAKVTIVEFSDFECGACRKVYTPLKIIVDKYKDKVKFIYKNYPLDQECNISIKHPMHLHACFAANFALCSGLQGKFWNVHEYLFNNHVFEKEISPKELQNIIYSDMDALQLDSDKMKDCMDNHLPKIHIEQDIKEGNKLQISGTPSIFINGKKLDSDFDPDLVEFFLQKLIL